MSIHAFLDGTITPIAFKEEVLRGGREVSQILTALSTKTLYVYDKYLVLIDDDPLETDCIVLILDLDNKVRYVSKHVEAGTKLVLRLLEGIK